MSWTCCASRRCRSPLEQPRPHARIRLVNQQLREAHRQLDALTARLIPSEETGLGQRKQHDVAILASLPGVGRIVLATLLAKAFDALQRRDYAALRSLTGVAPVTKRSGKNCIVVRRQACHDRLANAMYHWARVAVQHRPQKPLEICRPPKPRSQPWPSLAIDRRPPSQCRLRHAENRDHFQPLPRDRKKSLINGGSPPPRLAVSRHSLVAG